MIGVALVAPRGVSDEIGAALVGPHGVHGGAVRPKPHGAALPRGPFARPRSGSSAWPLGREAARSAGVAADLRA